MTAFSNALADAVEKAAPSVVQVQGRRRPGSGVVYGPETVVTNARALGSEDGLTVRSHDGVTFAATLAGWDPATGLAVLRAPGLTTVPAEQATAPARPGHFALGVARSWSNAVTASAGTVAIIGGPLATGRRQRIDEVIRTTAPMHDGFAGGAFVNTEGALIGITTAASIRGLRVVIPAAIAWKTAEQLLREGRTKRGYLGIAGQLAALSPAQRQVEDRASALLVVGVTAESPAAHAGVLVGDLLLDLDDHRIESPEALFDLLSGSRVGQAVALRVLRGTSVLSVPVTVAERAH